MRRYIYTLIIIAVTVVSDVLTKYWVVQNIAYHDRIDFLSGFVRITLTYNRGGVFGILQGYKNLFLIVSIVVLILMIIYYIYEKSESSLFNVSMSLIMGGAVGNIIDRLIPGRPGVVDFISVGIDGTYRWPTFNVADSVIVVGACLLVILFYKEEKKRKKDSQ
ncbi:signal peptidase II [Spirochaetota bacterium]